MGGDGGGLSSFWNVFTDTISFVVHDHICSLAFKPNVQSFAKWNFANLEKKFIVEHVHTFGLLNVHTFVPHTSLINLMFNYAKLRLFRPYWTFSLQAQSNWTENLDLEQPKLQVSSLNVIPRDDPPRMTREMYQ